MRVVAARFVLGWEDDFIYSLEGKGEIEEEFYRIRITRLSIRGSESRASFHAREINFCRIN